MSENSTSLRFAIFHSAAELDVSWHSVPLTPDVFLSLPYLSSLERNAPEGMRFVYVLFWLGQHIVGRAYFQIKHFSASEHIRNADTEDQDACFFNALVKWMRRWVSRRVKSDVLICGNLLCTGEHHFQFDQSRVTPDQFITSLELVIKQISETLLSESRPFVLIKDLVPQREDCCGALRRSYSEFQIQPNMVMDIVWPTFDAYLADMTTKYRTRCKRARKKLEPIKRRTLQVEEARSLNSDIFTLYEAVATNVGFNMVDLNPDYLIGLMEDIPDQFTMYGYFSGERLVGFCTLIENHTELETHFIGFDKSLNVEHQLYLNMLYDMVEFGISRGFKRIVFARTAPEIKSTVGAVPEQLNCYLRADSRLTNMVTPHMIEYLKPAEDWVQRHPFKEETNAQGS